MHSHDQIMDRVGRAYSRHCKAELRDTGVQWPSIPHRRWFLRDDGRAILASGLDSIHDDPETEALITYRVTARRIQRVK